MSESGWLRVLSAFGVEDSDYLDWVLARLTKGKREYGDASFRRAPQSLLWEIRQECLDIAGWAVVLTHVLERRGELTEEIVQKLAVLTRRAEQMYQSVEAIEQVLYEQEAVRGAQRAPG